ncbi:MAG: hypothetical protein NC037_00315 [Bacteroides sp.]|nr:hypothetical protein [Bacillota bacterium]MCM1393738.1 hypothetical protein [[Eubacterium] siraeum]MCM1454961.1 hypothetical protein [Bacteroides sp.]
MERLTESSLDSGFIDDDLILRQAYNRLAELEDKIENGTLVEVPCKIGDIVYQVCNACGLWDIEEWRITSTQMTDGKLTLINVESDIPFVIKVRKSFEYPLGQNLFFTRKKAEKRLEELKNERNNKVDELTQH